MVQLQQFRTGDNSFALETPNVKESHHMQDPSHTMYARALILAYMRAKLQYSLIGCINILVLRWRRIP